MNYETICKPMKKTKKAIRLIREELISRIEIQQRSLDTYSKEIFENVGQVLSLVKLQLLTLQSDEKNRSTDVSDSGKLLAKAIADLRNLTRQLSPDEVIKNGFGHSITWELKRLDEAGFCRIELSVEGNAISVNEAKELVIFCILQQLAYPLLDIYNPGYIKVGIHYKKAKIEIEVKREFKQEPLYLNIDDINAFNQRLKTVDGSLGYKKHTNDILQLTINI
jgi:signal transduction histidine kinase